MFGIAPTAIAFSTTIIVNTTNDELNADGDCSLREAIESANTDTAVDACTAGSDDDTIEVPAGTYTLTIEGANEDYNQTGDLDIAAGSLTINGAGMDNTVIQAGTVGGLNGNGIDRVIHVRGFTANEGIIAEVSLTLVDVTIANGKCECGGGGIRNGGEEGSTVTIINSTVTGNTSTEFGGGISNDPGAMLVVTNSVISENWAYIGGGISNSWWEGPATLVVTNTAFIDNFGFSGGGINSFGIETEITVSDSSFTGNNAHDGGGINNSGALEVIDSVFTNNYARDFGGAIKNQGAITLINSILSLNSSTYGGALYSSLTYPWYSESVITINISGTNFSENSATRGGGMYLDGDPGDFGHQTLANSSIINNHATEFGGGIYFGDVSNSHTISNSTISSNNANKGGGIFDASPGVTVVNSTLSNNSAEDGGAIWGGDIARYRNTIIANSSSGANCSQTYNEILVENGGNNLQFGGTIADSCSPEITVADPKLSPLTNNGGTTLTYALLPNSLAIDAGDNEYCPTTDQRGISRPLDGDGDTVAICDIGAFEFENTPIGSNVSVQIESGGIISTTVVLTYAQIDQPGISSVTTSMDGFAVPNSYSLGSSPTYYEINTTATFSPPVTACIDYDEDHYSSANNLRLLHYENDTWVDVTTSNDMVNHIICGQTNSLSPFVVAEQLLTYNFTGFFQPVDNLPILNVVKAGSAIPVKFNLGGDYGLNIFVTGYPSSVLVTCGTTAEDAIESTVSASSSSISFDLLTNIYSYIWKTDKSWAGTCRTLVLKFADGSYHRANFRFK